MSRTQPGRASGWHGALGPLLIAILALVSLPGAVAQDMQLQLDLDLRMEAWRPHGGDVESATHVAPRAQLLWRGPLRGGTNIFADLDATASLLEEPGLSTNEQDLRLTLRADNEPISLLATVGRNRTRQNYYSPTLGDSVLESVTDNLSLTGTVYHPNYPLISLQYQWSSGDSNGAKFDSTYARLGANYDYGPWRFQLDEALQEDGLSDTSFRYRQFGGVFTRALTPAVSLSLEQYFGSTETEGFGHSSSSYRTTLARLSAVPSPYLVLDGELTLTDSDQEGDFGSTDSSNFGHLLALRSDPLPGMRLDMSTRGQRTKSDGYSASSSHFTTDVAMQLPPDTTIFATYSKSRFSGIGAKGGGGETHHQVSARTPVFGPAELQLSYSRSDHHFGVNRDKTTSYVAGLQGDIGASLTGMLQARQDTYDAEWAGGGRHEVTKGLQLEGSWSPNEAWDLTLGVNLLRTTGTRHSEIISPLVELRWDLDEMTTLTTRYNMQYVKDEFDTFSGQQFRDGGFASYLTANLTRRLSDTEWVDIMFDSQASERGTFAWRQVLQLRWSKRF